MCKILIVEAFLGFATSAHAVDMQQLNESVDKQKAVDYVDTEKATAAVKERDV